MKYLDFVVDPTSPVLQNGVVDVELTLPNDHVFARTCKHGDVFKISPEDLLECQDALIGYVHGKARYFQDGGYARDPAGCIDFMEFVMTPTQARVQKVTRDKEREKARAKESAREQERLREKEEDRVLDEQRAKHK